MSYRWTWNRLLWLLGTKFLHGFIVLFLFLSHKDVLVSKVQTEYNSTVITLI